MEIKLYSNKQNAIRAGKKLYPNQKFEAVLDITENKYFIELVEQTEPATPAEPAAPTEQTETTEQSVQIIQGFPWIRNSSIVRPTKQVWHIADAMPNATRKEVIAACIDAGIAFYTARTQYQLWKNCQKEMEERKAHQAAA